MNYKKMRKVPLYSPYRDVFIYFDQKERTFYQAYDAMAESRESRALRYKLTSLGIGTPAGGFANIGYGACFNEDLPTAG